MPTQGELFELAKIEKLEDQPGCCLDAACLTRYRLVLVREDQEPYDKLGACLREPLSVARFLHELLVEEYREIFGALFLDGRHRAIGHTLAYAGTINKAVIEARGIFVPALLANAQAVLLFHNHPSGDATPSREDRQVTRQMVKAGKLLGVRVLDHLVLGEAPTYFSLREDGCCDDA